MTYIPYVVRKPPAPAKIIKPQPQRKPEEVRLLTRFRQEWSTERAMQIVDNCALEHGSTVKAVFSRTRNPQTVWARQDAMWIIYNELECSYPSLGRFFKMHHTTIQHSIDRAIGRYFLKQTILKVVEGKPINVWLDKRLPLARPATTVWPIVDPDRFFGGAPKKR